MVIGREDPLIGTLPQNNMSGSPALAGQPPAIAGQGSTPMVPTPEMQGGPALAPASPESGSADIGAPLPSDAPEQQAGAGANLDLVKDRGTPSEYWATNIKTLGSAKTMDLMASAANAASGKTGKQADMDPEEVRRAGVQANEAFGVGNTQEQQDVTVEKLIYKPMSLQIQNEVATGVIDKDEGVFRIAQTLANVQGVENEDEARRILTDARVRIDETETEDAEPVIGQAEAETAEEEVEENEPDAGTAEATAKAAEVDGAEMDRLIAGKAQVDYETERARMEAAKDYDKPGTEGYGEKDNIWKRFKNWVKKGKDDPTTSVDESKQTVIGKDGKPVLEDVEVTKFMGGMTRQELGMFVFQWGALMMSNADQGFGGAMGAASQGALAGHQARGASEDASALAAEELQIKKDDSVSKSRQADAAMITAEANRTRATYAGVGYQGKDAYLAARYKKEGMSDKEINAILRGVEGTEIRAQKLQDNLQDMIENASFTDTITIDGKEIKVNKITPAQQKQWIIERLKSAADAAAEYDAMQKGESALSKYGDPSET